MSGEHLVLGGFQVFFCCSDTAHGLECQSCWLWLPFGNQFFCFLEFRFGQHGSHLIHFFLGASFESLKYAYANDKSFGAPFPAKYEPDKL